MSTKNFYMSTKFSIKLVKNANNIMNGYLFFTIVRNLALDIETISHQKGDQHIVTECNR